MGGSINIAARFNNGDTICVDGWTNFIPNMVCNDTTLSGDDSVVRKTLMEVVSYDAYGGLQQFRPSGYGMVAIDFVTKKIHSKQGYTSFTNKGLNQLIDLSASGWRRPGVYINVFTPEGASLLDNGRVIHEGKTLTQKTAKRLQAKALRAMFSQGSIAYNFIEIITEPFTVIDYDETGSLTSMKNALREDGFPMRKADGLNVIIDKIATKGMSS